MINPLLNRQRNISKREVDRPEAVQPIPETYAGDNHPYRGVESHGVADNESPHDVPKYDSRIGVTYLPPEKEEDPVPVRIVQSGGREQVSWRADRYLMRAGETSRVIGANEQRRNLTLKNIHATDVVYISNESIPSTGFGFPLAAGQTMSLSTATTDVWGFNGGANDVTVAFYYEYAVEL